MGRNSKRIVLIGGGGHCTSVLDCILSRKEFDEIVIVDSKLPLNSKIMNCLVVGDDSKLSELKKNGFDYAFITVGSIKSTGVRRKLYQMSRDLGFKFPIICDPSSRISDYSSLGEGTFVGKNAVVNAKAVVGEHCIINTGSVIEHECCVGDFTHISVGSFLCGNCSVGHDSFVGAASTVIQGVNIGNNVIIGAGSTVISNVDDNMKVFGLVKCNINQYVNSGGGGN